MKTLKKIADVTKKASPSLKKVLPLLSTALNSLDLLEHTSKLAKPFIEDARIKGIEKSKIIYAQQKEEGDRVIIAIEKAGLIAISGDEEGAFELLMSKLLRLKEKRILNSDKKIQKEQKKLIDKMNWIVEDQGEIRNYIYRTEVTQEQHPITLGNFYKKRGG